MKSKYNNIKLRLYHGTNSDFDSFDTKYFNSGSGDGGWLGKGIYLTNDYDYASSYGDVIECEVTLNNPLVLDDHMYSRRPDRLKNELGASNSGEATKKMIEMGYDSVILKYDDTEFGGLNDFMEVCVFDPSKIKILKKNKDLEETIRQIIKEEVDSFFEKNISEVRVINPDSLKMIKEPPIKDSQTIRVYHGFNNYEDAISALKFGLSGKELARRIYSYESNNNPNGLFVTLDFDTAKKFSYPRGKKGIVVVLELNVKASDLEAPVWPGGSYTVQGQMAQFWKDKKDRYEKGTLKSREEASKSDIEFIHGSDRPELAASLLGPEKQALFVGDLNSNMIKSIWYGESGKHGYSPKRLEKISPKEFLEKFKDYDPDYQSSSGQNYIEKKNRLFGPKDDFSEEILNDKIKDFGEESVEDFINNLREKELHYFFWPKQIEQIKIKYGKK